MGMGYYIKNVVHPYKCGGRWGVGNTTLWFTKRHPLPNVMYITTRCITPSSPLLPSRAVKLSVYHLSRRSFSHRVPEQRLARTSQREPKGNVSLNCVWAAQKERLPHTDTWLIQTMSLQNLPTIWYRSLCTKIHGNY